MPRLAILSLSLVCLTQGLAADGFGAGDSFHYDLHWSMIKVGKAELSFAEEPLEPGGPELLHAVFTVRTHGLADKLFKVRDRIESWIDPETGRPVFYKKKQHEGSTKRNIEIRFDWDALTATYVNDGDVHEPIEITEDTFDPLSLIVFLAQQDFTDKTALSQAVTDGKKLVYIDADVQGRESIKTKAGKFETRLLDVATKELRGVFEKSPDASIEVWLSTDQPAIPLKMKSEVAVGSFHGQLRKASYQGRDVGD